MKMSRFIDIPHSFHTVRINLAMLVFEKQTFVLIVQPIVHQKGWQQTCIQQNMESEESEAQELRNQETKKKLQLQYLVSWSKQNNIKETCVFRPPV